MEERKRKTRWSQAKPAGHIMKKFEKTIGETSIPREASCSIIYKLILFQIINDLCWSIS